jgi:hypothetical protein
MYINCVTCKTLTVLLIQYIIFCHVSNRELNSFKYTGHGHELVKDLYKLPCHLSAGGGGGGRG